MPATWLVVRHDTRCRACYCRDCFASLATAQIAAIARSPHEPPELHDEANPTKSTMTGIIGLLPIASARSGGLI
jgi:hypothetical protein